VNGQDVVRLIVMHPAEFALGYDEGLDSMGMTYDDDPGSDRSVAYDLGRSLRESCDPYAPSEGCGKWGCKDCYPDVEAS
jgi:hypothetical protein